MKLNKVVVRIALAVAVVFAAGTAARGLVILKGEPAQKHRKSIDKQTAKFAICVGKAALECEAAGTSDSPECDLDGNPPASTVPAEAIAELADDLAKCESKVDLAKKGNDYAALGCPGDCGAEGNCGTIAAYQSAAIQNTYVQIEALGAILSAICADSQCTLDQGDLGVAYAKAVFKCITKCENDYKDKKGNGGDNDDIVRCDPADSADANFLACITKAEGKAVGINVAFRDGLDNAISDGRHDLYNEDDCP